MRRVKNQKPRTRAHHWEEGHTNDRWVVVADHNLTDYVCTLVDLVTEHEWRVLVVGHNITCCR